MSATAAFACAEALLRALVRAGLDGVVVSPGSRSTPLAVVASRLGLVRAVIVDERAAAFFALGRAEQLGAPMGLICTSGTAAANYSPAVIEASQRRIPLVVLSADRPPEAHGVGANQTIEQGTLFEGFLRHRAMLPAAADDAIDAWMSAGAAAGAAATRGPRGPVHLNAPFREPFIPEGGGPTLEPIAPTERPATQPMPAVIPTAFLEALPRPTRGALVIGPDAAPADVLAARATADRLGWPTIASVIGAARTDGTVGALAIDEHPDPGHIRADLVVRVGMSSTTRGVLAYEAAASRCLTIDRDGWVFDPARDGRPSVTVHGTFPESAFDALVAPESWRPTLLAAEHAAQDVLAAWIDAADALDEIVLAHLLLAGGLDRGVFVGNSTPIRDAERSASPGARLVVANRGASGIDGLVSTFAGHASVRPMTALLGDLSVFHDASGLLTFASMTAGTLVVVDNDGGGIFDLLASRTLPEHERLFSTPHGGRLDALLSASGGSVVDARTPSELLAVLAEPVASPPMRIIRVPVDRDEAIARRAAFGERVRAAIGSVQSA